MERFKILILALLFVGLYGCKKDDAEFSKLSELGAETSEYIVPAAAGEVDIHVLSNADFDITISDDASWMSTAASDLHGDADFTVHYEENLDFPRKGLVMLYAKASSRYDTIVVKQQGAKIPELLFPMLNTTVLGDGGTIISELQTNIPMEDVAIQVVYPIENTDEWVSDDFAYDAANEKLTFSVKANPHMDNLRSAQIRLSYTDGWGEQLVSTLYLLQANAQNLFGTEATYPEVRTWAGERITSDLFIQGYVVSDAGNQNVGENQQTTPTTINYEQNDRTVYIQSLDGQYGFRIETATIADNVFKRYSKVQLLLKGATIEIENNPSFYTIRDVTSAMVMSQEQGTAVNLVKKEKYISELTDNDIFTFVTLKDCELPIRKGSLTPVNEGYTTLFNAHRISKYPLLMRDIQGSSMFLLTNTRVPYRRDGSILPQGSGSVSGVIVHETFTRFEYEDASNPDDYGNIGRYQIRHLAKEDIAIASNVDNGFSALLAEYQYPNLSSGIAFPTNGDNGRLYASNNVNVTASSDYTYLGPVGKDYLGNNNQWGTGVLLNGTKQNTSSDTNKDGKGGAVSSSIAANRLWWNYEKNRGEAWIIEVSTLGVATSQLSLQFTAANWTVPGSPRYWAVEWSEHGDMDGIWAPIAKYTVPDIVNWSNTLLHQLPGFKNVNVALPLAVLSKPKVYIRLIVDKNLSSNGNTYATEMIGGNANSALGYVAIRYNK
ncbi:BACON domain-containing protein [Sphingobacterium sp. SGG-5]|uniref:DUF5689 domain-containing protein n=1 Tax=Sphingobacterium sp. SGG-5 TaxID=2710881 RepID=UPI0013EC6A65|nr:DUF5689 domain-containing protein [Sphingobacterium sp. SGG-5]NGM60295.1 BACON domain-containing protein [Sphingobacterium sp. SGG-5]